VSAAGTLLSVDADMYGDSHYYCGGSPADAQSAASAYQRSEDASALSLQCGCYTMTFGCTDVNGRDSTDSQQVCVVDDTPPEIKIEEGYYSFFAKTAAQPSGQAGLVMCGALVGAFVAVRATKRRNAYEAL